MTPCRSALAAELSGRDDAGSVLDRLEHRTSLVTATGPHRDGCTTSRNCCAPIWSPTCSATACDGWPALHAVAARWWAAQDQPLPALEHATHSHDEDAAHRPAAPVRHPTDPGRRPRPAAARDGRCRCAGRGGRSLAVPGLRAHPPGGGRALPPRRATCATPSSSGLHTPAWISRCCGRWSSSWVQTRPAPSRPPSADTDELPAAPELEALARLSRGDAYLEHDDRAGARAEFGAALALSRLPRVRLPDDAVPRAAGRRRRRLG